jgi:lysophospholipase L1-like esterase
MSFIFEGDSITYGHTLEPNQAMQCFGYQFSQLPFAKGHGSYYNFGVTGYNIANITSDYPTLVRPNRPTAKGGTGGVRSYLFVDIGTNDITNYAMTGAQVIAALNTYVTAAQNDGFTVIVATLLGRGYGEPGDSYRHQVNEAIRNGAVVSNGIVDYAALIDMTSTSYSSDGCHPNLTGHTVMASYLNAVMIAGGCLSPVSYSTFLEQAVAHQGLNITSGQLLVGSAQGADSTNLLQVAGSGTFSGGLTASTAAFGGNVKLQAGTGTYPSLWVNDYTGAYKLLVGYCNPGAEFGSGPGSAFVQTGNGAPLVMNAGSASVYLSSSTGDVLVDTWADDGVNKFQVNGSAKVTGNLNVSGVLQLSGTTSAPANPGTAATWVSVLVNGTAYKIPIYQ